MAIPAGVPKGNTKGAIAWPGSGGAAFVDNLVRAQPDAITRASHRPRMPLLPSVTHVSLPCMHANIHALMNNPDPTCASCAGPSRVAPPLTVPLHCLNSWWVQGYICQLLAVLCCR